MNCEINSMELEARYAGTWKENGRPRGIHVTTEHPDFPILDIEDREIIAGVSRSGMVRHYLDEYGRCGWNWIG